MIHRSRRAAPTRRRRVPRRVLALLPAVLLLAAARPPDGEAQGRRPRQAARPNVVLITIDTLRADHLSGYGYRRRTSPDIDRLIAGGARFDQARTVEPLTNPSCTSMLTSMYPHEHGATRNGLRMRPNLPSLPRALDRAGYLTGAFVANWTLKNDISGFAEHFEHFEEVLTRKRWFGLFAQEADAADVNEAALAWADENALRRRPIFLWVHYVEPHAPYKFHSAVTAQLGMGHRSDGGKADRYDTEIAFVDRYVGQLVRHLEALPALAGNTLFVFSSDHGESLGEHGYWGHGRHLYEPGLHIPLVFYWPGRIRPQQVAAPATNLDIAATVLGLVGSAAPPTFQGFDWSAVLAGRGAPDPERTTWYQAHKGAVLSVNDSRGARRDGLLELALLRDGTKEIVQVRQREHEIFDLRRDPHEKRNLNGSGYRPSPRLRAWVSDVEKALDKSADAPPPDVTAEEIEKLKSLGYVD